MCSQPPSLRFQSDSDITAIRKRVRLIMLLVVLNFPSITTPTVFDIAVCDVTVCNASVCDVVIRWKMLPGAELASLSETLPVKYGFTTITNRITYTHVHELCQVATFTHTL